MRILCGRNGGTFVGIDNHEDNPRVLAVTRALAAGCMRRGSSPSSIFPPRWSCGSRRGRHLHSPEFRTAVHRRSATAPSTRSCWASAIRGLRALMGAMFTRTIRSPRPMRAAARTGDTRCVEPILRTIPSSRRAMPARYLAVSVSTGSRLRTGCKMLNPGPSTARGRRGTYAAGFEQRAAGGGYRPRDERRGCELAAEFKDAASARGLLPPGGTRRPRSHALVALRCLRRALGPPACPGRGGFRRRHCRVRRRLANLTSDAPLSSGFPSEERGR